MAERVPTIAGRRSETPSTSDGMMSANAWTISGNKTANNSRTCVIISVKLSSKVGSIVPVINSTRPGMKAIIASRMPGRAFMIESNSVILSSLRVSNAASNPPSPKNAAMLSPISENCPEIAVPNPSSIPSVMNSANFSVAFSKAGPTCSFITDSICGRTD